MAWYYLLVSLLISVIMAQDQRILQPVKNGKDAGVVFIPGALIRYDQYRFLAEQLQDASDLRLWVYLADGFLYQRQGGLPEVASEDTTIGDAKLQLQRAGMPEGIPFFAMGHSMGGRIAQIEIDLYPDMASAVLLLGSKFDSDFDSFPVPACTITGDLDGLNRVSTMAEVFNGLKIKVDDGRQDFKYRYPLKMIEGTNHMPFVTGPSTDVVREFDINAEIEDEAAREKIVETMTVFMNYIAMEGDKASQEEAMDRWYAASAVILQPILDAFSLDEDNVRGESPWIIEAQRIVANLNEQDDLLLGVSNQVVDGDSLPGVRPGFASGGERQVVNTYVTVTYDFFTGGVDYNSPYMLEAKMKNGDAIAYQLGTNGGDYISCKNVNEILWDKVLNMIPEKNRARFEAKNILVNFEDDEDAIAGPIWIFGELKFEFDGSVLDIQSVVLWTDRQVDEEFGGMQYCKLLAPSRVVDFMYTEALRNYE